MSRQNRVVVIDNGTGFTKMGYAGNIQPSFIIPTTISTNVKQTKKELSDLDFYIGNEAIKKGFGNYSINYPMKEGMVSNWDNMEKYWEQCFYKYLKCEPDQHYVMLTEPPLNAPENREYSAEIMFETFGIAGLYIAVQAVLALSASWTAKKSKKLKLSGTMTGTVIDSGDGVTHVIPVADGYVIGSSIKHIPLAGRNITKFVHTFIKERETGIPPEESLLLAQKIKEQYCYVCSDVAKEFGRFDISPEKMVKNFSSFHKKTQKEWNIDIGYEQFLGPEIFFNPQIFSSQFTTPLPDLTDQVIQSCPIDCRRPLYRNIVLSGGSTMFQKFGRRVERDIQRVVDARLERAALVNKMKTKPKPIEVNVISHPMQRYAVWFGGSMVGSTPKFHTNCHSKADYDEHGPSIARHSRIFSS